MKPARFITLLFAVWPLLAENNSSLQTSTVISADLLRHPITEKARRMLRKALEAINSGQHQSAIRQLLDVLTKYPESAAYTQSLLGVEYIRVDQFTAAVDSLEQAVALLPHDAFNRYNLGLSLACTGDFERGEQEVRRALDLDRGNPTMQALLNALVRDKLAKAKPVELTPNERGQVK
jgi:Flp pilus assembly protein TadD